MVVSFVIFLFLTEITGLKIWLPSTDFNNKMNWDLQDTPKDCDRIHFHLNNDIATFWNLKDITISGLSLSTTGDIIFSDNTKIQFKDKEKCPQIRDIRYIRNKIEGWLDPENWESDSENQWLPHSERIPCAGETIRFPPGKTFAIQLPSILVPVGNIFFDNSLFEGQTWPKFLRTELGYQIFKGSDDIRSLPWRKDIGCFDKKKCICGRSSYSIRNGVYKDVSPHIFEEAVCLYVMPKCKPSECFSAVIPEGHCCGICGAVIKVEDKTEEGLDLEIIKKQVEVEIKKYDAENQLKSYVGRTKDGRIQIVLVAERSGDTIKSHTLANHIEKNLIEQRFRVKISSRVSGLSFSNYIFNSVSGAVFGTLFATLAVFVSLFYFYVVFPKKKFQETRSRNPFMFARFDNTLHDSGSEENLEIGVEPSVSEELPQAFDNPIYSSTSDVPTVKEDTDEDLKTKVSDNNSEVASTTKEFNNPVYADLNKSENIDVFDEIPQKNLEEFKEIEL